MLVEGVGVDVGGGKVGIDGVDARDRRLDEQEEAELVDLARSPLAREKNPAHGGIGEDVGVSIDAL